LFDLRKVRCLEARCSGSDPSELSVLGSDSVVLVLESLSFAPEHFNIIEELKLFKNLNNI